MALASERAIPLNLTQIDSVVEENERVDRWTQTIDILYPYKCLKYVGIYISYHSQQAESTVPYFAA